MCHPVASKAGRVTHNALSKYAQIMRSYYANAHTVHTHNTTHKAPATRWPRKCKRLCAREFALSKCTQRQSVLQRKASEFHARAGCEIHTAVFEIPLSPCSHFADTSRIAVVCWWVCNKLVATTRRVWCENIAAKRRGVFVNTDYALQTLWRLCINHLFSNILRHKIYYIMSNTSKTTQNIN